MPGPVPKRSDERIRRNEDVPIDKVTAIGVVEVPPLDIKDPHPLITEFYDSLAESAQSKYYEPSDWVYAKFTLHFANKLVKAAKPSAQMLMAINSMLTELLVSEGARRRLRLEIERNPSSSAKVVDVAAMFAARAAGK
jgi:hypothetical protein